MKTWRSSKGRNDRAEENSRKFLAAVHRSLAEKDGMYDSREITLKKKSCSLMLGLEIHCL